MLWGKKALTINRCGGLTINKRGELTSQQIVTIIILIVSFVIILIFFLTLNLRSEIGKESCRNSVALRGSALGKGTSLNCKTEDVCLSMGGKCDEAGSNVQIIKVKNQDELKEKLANLMYDCWYQIGEGKVDYLPTNYGTEANYCAICNRIYVDDNIRDKGWGKINAEEYYTYLADKKTPDGKTTMLYYLHGLSSLDSVFQSLEGTVNVNELNYDFGNKQGYALVTSISKEGLWSKGTFIGAGIGVVAGVTAVATGGVSIPIYVAVIGGGAAGGGIGFASTDLDITAMAPAFYPYNENNLKALNCKEFSTLP